LEKKGSFSHACDLFETLLTDLENNENYYMKNETMTKYVSLLMNMVEYKRVIELYEKEIKFHNKLEKKVVNLN